MHAAFLIFICCDANVLILTWVCQKSDVRNGGDKGRRNLWPRSSSQTKSELTTRFGSAARSVVAKTSSIQPFSWYRSGRRHSRSTSGHRRLFEQRTVERDSHSPTPCPGFLRRGPRATNGGAPIHPPSEEQPYTGEPAREQARREQQQRQVETTRIITGQGGGRRQRHEERKVLTMAKRRKVTQIHSVIWKASSKKNRTTPARSTSAC